MSNVLLLEAVRSQIKAKRVLLTRLNEQMVEFKRLQVEINQIPTIKADVEALERTLSILKGEEVKPELAQTGLPQIMDALAGESTGTKPVAAYVTAVLREAAKPLSFSQIVPLIAAKGCTADTPTIRGAVYRNAKSGRLFKLAAPGVFGLVEWQ